MRLIDADACRAYFYEHLDDNGVIGAMNAIEEMPTVYPDMATQAQVNDLVRIVRVLTRAVFAGEGSSFMRERIINDLNALEKKLTRGEVQS